MFVTAHHARMTPAARVQQVHSVLALTESGDPRDRGLAISAPLCLLLFAATYYPMSAPDPRSFNVRGVNRADTLYFAVTVLTTVGFGAITATSQITRIVVTLQTGLDLIVLGLGVRVFVGGVPRSWSTGDGRGRDRSSAWWPRCGRCCGSCTSTGSSTTR
jgi:hypothetical protein